MIASADLLDATLELLALEESDECCLVKFVALKEAIQIRFALCKEEFRLTQEDVTA